MVLILVFSQSAIRDCPSYFPAI